ncbi:MAG: ribulose-phosphate 3-epimerase [Actinomycetales bacterium]|nr:ribulose-phosphate 3-epimerase [Actinomycetales bacterium]
MAILISPSVLNSDLSNLTGEVARISAADYVHLDVMDNHFVPNLTFGLPVIERLLAATDMPADVHLMIEDPDTWAPAFAEAGAKLVTFHAEASTSPVRLARELRKLGARAAIALKPATAVEPFLDLLSEFDMVLVMTVEPGFGGQSFIDGTLPKIRRTRDAITALGADIWVQVDGGVSRATIERAAGAGANMFVAGSAVYIAEDPNAEISALRELARAAYKD